MKAQKIERVMAEIRGLKTVNAATWNRLQPLISRDKRVVEAMRSVVPALDSKQSLKFSRPKAIYFGIVDTNQGKVVHVGLCSSSDPESDDGWPAIYQPLEWPAGTQPNVSSKAANFWIFDYLIPLTITALAVKHWCCNNEIDVPVYVGFDAGDAFRIHN